MILFGEQSLRTAIHNFVAHYHIERNHQGLANRLISPEPSHFGNTGKVQQRQRLGGMLNYYCRAARGRMRGLELGWRDVYVLQLPGRNPDTSHGDKPFEYARTW